MCDVVYGVAGQTIRLEETKGNNMVMNHLIEDGMMKSSVNPIYTSISEEKKQEGAQNKVEHSVLLKTPCENNLTVI
jgi:hypothetical protein